MINPNDHIRFSNVVSRKYQFHYHNMDEVMTDFLNDIINIKASIKGPLFYSINNIPLDEIVYAEFFMPLEEDDRLEIMDDMSFHSYFSIEEMISCCLFQNFERDTEFAYKKLLDYMEQNGQTQVTPIFHVISGDETLQYMIIKIGISKEKID